MLAKSAGWPLSSSWATRRRARSSGEAVRKIFSWAFGSTTVPMSRPSMSTLFLRARSRWSSSRNARTAGMADTFEAAMDTSGVRMSPVTSRPHKYIF